MDVVDTSTARLSGLAAVGTDGAGTTGGVLRAMGRGVSCMLLPEGPGRGETSTAAGATTMLSTCVGRTVSATAGGGGGVSSTGAALLL